MIRRLHFILRIFWIFSDTLHHIRPHRIQAEWQTTRREEVDSADADYNCLTSIYCGGQEEGYRIARKARVRAERHRVTCEETSSRKTGLPVSQESTVGRGRTRNQKDGSHEPGDFPRSRVLCKEVAVRFKARHQGQGSSIIYLLLLSTQTLLNRNVFLGGTLPL